MNALAVRSAFSDDAGGDFHAGDAGFGLLLVRAQLVQHRIRHMYAGDVVVHEFAHTYGLRNDDAYLNGLSELLRLLHEGDELLRLEDSLRLEILRAGRHLALHLHQLGVDGIAAGGNHRALGELRRLAHQLVSAQILALLQQPHRIEQGNGIKIEHRLRVRMIAHLRVIACQRQHILDAEHRRAEKIRFQRDPVAVTAGKLEDRIEPGVLQRLADSQRAEPHNGRLVIRDVDRVHTGEIRLRALDQLVDMASLRRPHLRGNNELTLLEKICHFHFFHRSSLNINCPSSVSGLLHFPDRLIGVEMMELRRGMQRVEPSQLPEPPDDPFPSALHLRVHLAHPVFRSAARTVHEAL